MRSAVENSTSVEVLSLGNFYSLSAKFLIVFCLLFLGGCVKLEAGFDFPEEQVQNIQLRKTTKEEIRNIFGEPWRIGLENGKETWTYGKYSYRGSTETAAKDLVVRFTQDNFVESYTFSKTNR